MEQPNKLLTTKKIRLSFNCIGLAFMIMISLWLASAYLYYYGLENYGFYLHGYDMSTINAMIGIFVKTFSLFIPFFLIRFLLKIDFKDIFKRTGHSLRGYISFFCLGIAIYLFLTFLSTTLYTVFHVNWIQGNPVDNGFQTGNLFIKGLYLVYFIIIVPVLEEYVFRGIILRTVSKLGGLFGLICSSLLYAVYCFGRSEFILVLGVGFFLSMLSMIYQSIWPSVIAHIGINVVILYSLFVPSEFSWFLGIIAVIVYALTLYGIYRNRSRRLVWKTSVPSRVAWGCFACSPLLLLSIVILILRGIYTIIV